MPLSQDEIDAAYEKVAAGEGVELGGRSCRNKDEVLFAIQAASNESGVATAVATERSDEWKELMKKNGPQLRKIAEDLKLEVAADAAREAIADMIVAVRAKS